jgi:hypothetical protein
MPLIPLKIPAGVRDIGTDLDNTGRWIDSSLVRWVNGSMRPVGGWEERDDLSSSFTDPPRSMHVWLSNSNNEKIAIGSASELYAVEPDGTATNITPPDYVAGSGTVEENLAYGGGVYETTDALYGNERPSTGVLTEADTWSIDNWGEYLVGCSTSDGRLLEWRLNTDTNVDMLPEEAYLLQSLDYWSYDAQWSWTSNYGGRATYDVSVGATPPYEELSFYSDPLIDVDGYQKFTLSFAFTATTTCQFDVIVTDSDGFEYANETYTHLDSGSNSFTFNASAASLKISVTTTNENPQTFYLSQIRLLGQPSSLQILNAPTNNTGLTVTNERFIFAYGGKLSSHLTANPRRVIWCDREDSSTWTPTATNEAGDIELQTSGEIMQGVSLRNGTLIVTTTDAHLATYQGPPYVYGFQKVGSACGTSSRRTVVAVDQVAYWMGRSSFYMFDGQTARKMPCEVQDKVFNSINTQQITMTYGLHNSEHGEVWWFYPTSSSDCDTYVAYNYVENYWHTGEMDRTCGVDRGVYKKPIYCDSDGVLYNHEQVGKSWGTKVPFAETAPFMIGNGDNVMHVHELMPDEQSQGDVRVTFKSRAYPNATESVHEVERLNLNNPTSVRFTGRQVSMRVESQANHNWALRNGIYYAALGIQPHYDLFNVEIDGRKLGDFDNDGDVDTIDYSAAIQGEASSTPSANKTYYDTVVKPYAEQNYSRYKIYTTPVNGTTIASADATIWNVGTFRINAKEGGRR